MLPLPRAGQKQAPRPRGMSIRGSLADAEANHHNHRLPLPTGGVWPGRAWPDAPITGGGSSRSNRSAAGAGGLPVIVAFGDSHTQGQLGANWVDLLQARCRGQFRIVNCGKDGNVLESIRQRVGPVLQAYGEDVVGAIVMGGTNDCLANLNPSARKLIRMYNPFLPDLPPLDAYPKILEELVGTLYAHCSPFLQIVVMTPPLLGEDPAAPENAAVEQVCEAIRTMVGRFTRTDSHRRGRSTSTSTSTSGRGRRASSSSFSSSSVSGSLLQTSDGRVEAVNADGTPAVTKEQEQQEQQRRPRRASHDRTHHHGHGGHHHGHQHRRLHFIDWNRRMRQHLDEHYQDGRPRKRMEPRFLPMCLNTSVAVVGATLTQSFDKISDARGFALLHDGVHMNERAVQQLVSLLERWVEDVQEELYRMPRLLLSQQMGRLRLTASSAQVQQQQQQQQQQQPENQEAVKIPVVGVAKTEAGQCHRRSVSGAGSLDGDGDVEDEEGNEEEAEPQEVAVTVTA